MSKPSRTPRALTALAAFGALAAAAPAMASAATTLHYSCQYPLIGAAPTDVTATVANGRLSVSTASVTADGTDNTYTGLTLVRSTAVQGTINANLSLVKANGSVVDAVLPLTSPKANLPSEPPVGFGGSAPLPGALTAPGRLLLGELDLNLTAYDKNGKAITGLAAAQEFPDSDGDPTTFDVSCTLLPGQDATIAGDRTIPTPVPTKTPAPTATPTPVTKTPTPTPTATPDPTGANHVRYTAAFPLIGDAPADIAVRANATTLSLSYSSLAGADEVDNAVTGLRLVKAVSAGGTITATVSLVKPGGSRVTKPVVLTAAPGGLVEGQPFKLVTSAPLPQELRGAGRLELGAVALNLTAYKADGSKITALSQAQTVPPSDADVTTFDVPASQDGGQDATIPTGGGIFTPQPPVTPTPTPTPGPVVTPDPGPGQDATLIHTTANYPLVGVTKNDFRVGVKNGRLAVSAVSVAEADGSDPTFLLYVLTTAQQAGGTISVGVTLTKPGGSTVSKTLVLDSSRRDVAKEAPVTYSGSAALPSELAGAGSLKVTSIALNLTAYRADGSIITGIAGAQEGPDSDDSQNTFDVPTTIGAGQNTGVGGGTPVTPTKTPAPVVEKFKTKFTGQATLKAVPQGSLALSGSAWFSSAKGGTAVTSGWFQVAPATANLTVSGIPVVAKLSFTQVGGLTGTLAPGATKLATKVQIKVDSVTAAGSPVGIGSNCRVSAPSALSLTSADFSKTTAGTLKSTFEISGLTGCGSLNGKLSQAVAGAGNTLTLKLGVPAKQ